MSACTERYTSVLLDEESEVFMEEFKPKRKNNNYSGTDKAGAPRRAPRQNHQNKAPAGE